MALGGDTQDKTHEATPEAGTEPAVEVHQPVSTGHKHHDNSVSFEEYVYWAKISRADERFEDPVHDYTLFGKVLKKSRHPPATIELEQTNATSGTAAQAIATGEKALEAGGHRSGSDEKLSGRKGSRMLTITDDEYVNASRAVRTATWGAVFYLITTDILGPFAVPWAFAAMGYGPGVILYTIFGILAGYAGFLLWKCFLGLDSDRYPLSSYGDMAYRIFGNWARHVINFLQSIQLLINVAIIIVINGQSLEEIVQGSRGGGSVCYIILIFVWGIAGMLFGQIRTLQNLSWIANLSIWLNVFTMFACMGVVANSGVAADTAQSLNVVFNITDGQPIRTTAGSIPGAPFTVAVQGLTIAVFAYGGATVFIEFMAEMKRPFDFWKGMLFAQIFIYFFYMLFGLFVYSYQGQYSINPAYQGLAPYAWSTAMNAIQLITSLIAALLYGNIGIKIIYNHILMDVFGFPHLGSRGGKLAWIAVVPVYWGLSFIIGAAIPQVSNLQGFIGALAILQFSYTFPPIMMTGFLVKREAMLEGDGFDPATGQTVRQDGGWARYLRGYRRYFVFNTWNVVFALGSLATALLGIYSSVIGMIAAYSTGSSSSFSCDPPF